jgi:hypothetical protein
MDALNDILEELAGTIEYPVNLVLATWPDGCWHCCIQLTDKERAIGDGLLVAKLEQSDDNLTYDMIEGFDKGFTGWGSTPLEAAQDLKAKLLKLE